MKIYEEVLSKEHLHLCKEDIVKKQKQQVWESSSLRWESWLLKNIDGTCVFTNITDDTIKKILTSELSIAFINYDYTELVYQYYIWDSYSGIAPHNDGDYKFGATLYLNTNYLTDGGLFVWKDDECADNFYKCINPQENMMVVNDSKEEHFVTPISPHAKQYRYTIQIWGE